MSAQTMAKPLSLATTRNAHELRHDENVMRIPDSLCRLREHIVGIDR